jgi:hypothetical protein
MSASATAESVPDSFTLRQAVAWIAWHDPERPLLPELPEDSRPDSLQTWTDARWELRRQVKSAALALAEKIVAGTVAAFGLEVLKGSPGSGGLLESTDIAAIPSGRAAVIGACAAEWNRKVA